MNALGEMLVRGVSIDEIARRLNRNKIEVRDITVEQRDLAKYLPVAHDLEDSLSALAGRHADADATLQDGHHALAGCPFDEDSGSGGVSSSMRRCEDGIGILVAESGEQEGASEEIASLGECGSDQFAPNQRKIQAAGLFR